MIRLCLVATLSLLSGCGYALLQTARPVPPGELDVTLGGGFVYNRMIAKRGTTPDNIAPHVALRYGLTERLDLGVATFMGLGVQVDGKLNLLQPARHLAVSVQLGLGGAGFPDHNRFFGDTVIYLPARLLVSWDTRSMTPYASVGYGTFWVFGYGEREPGVRYASRKGYGDGLVMLTAGVELFGSARAKLLLEYGYWHQVVDDPGDFHSFADNHLFSAGIRF